MKFERITIDPAVCTGKPCIRGLRFPVSRLLGLLASGDAALLYAVFLAEEETLELNR